MIFVAELTVFLHPFAYLEDGVHRESPVDLWVLGDV